MQRVVIYLKRRADLARPVFFDWWLHHHGALAAQLPGGSSPPPPSDNVLISGGLARFLEPLCTHVMPHDYLVFCFMSDIIKPCILRSFPIALRRQRSCCASRFVTVTRSASAPWPTCPIGSPRAWRPCVGLSGENSIISQVGTPSVVRSLVSSMR